jgi:hypothetical protein
MGRALNNNENMKQREHSILLVLSEAQKIALGRFQGHKRTAGKGPTYHHLTPILLTTGPTENDVDRGTLPIPPFGGEARLGPA